MKHTNKKGFTIVELVIVIAVIAILAAVLIPTFSNLIKKANESADIQAVRQMNTVLKAETELKDLQAVIDALEANGYNAAESLKPITKGYNFFYIPEYKCIALVNEKSEVVFPKEVAYDAATAINLAEGVKYIDVVANDSATLQNSIIAGSNKIALTANATFTTATPVQNGDVINIDLGANTLTTGDRPNGGHHYAVKVNDGTVTIKNGTVVARGIELYGTSSLVLENVNVTAVDDNGGACVWNEGSSVTITGGVFTALNGNPEAPIGTINPGVIYNEGTTLITGGTFKSHSFTYAIKNKAGTTTINGGDFEAARGVISADEGTVTINGGTFAAECANGAHVLYAANGNIVVGAGVELIGDSIFALESNKEGKTYNGSITLKAGVIYNGVELAEDYVITQENQASVKSTLNDLVAAQ